MSELRKLFQTKRILAMVLAVVMTVTSVPVTAQAASLDNESTAAETNVEDISTENEEKGGQDIQPEDTPSENLPEEETSDQNSDQEDMMPGDTADVPNDNTHSSDQPQNSAEDVQDDDNAQNPADISSEQSENDATVAEGQAESTVGESAFGFLYYGETKYEYTQTGSPFADETGKKLSTLFLRDFWLTVNKETVNETERGLDNLEDDIVKTVKYQWFEGDKALGDAKLLGEEGVIPAEVGSYRLKFTLEAKENTYAAASGEYDFEITQAGVYITVGIPASVVPGTAVTAVAVPVIEEITATDGKDFKYVVDNKETPDDESKDNDVKFTAIIKDAETGSLAEGTLTGDKEYVITVAPEFIGANKDSYVRNYEFKPCVEQKLVIGNLKKTRVTLKLDAKYDASPYKD